MEIPSRFAYENEALPEEHGLKELSESALLEYVLASGAAWTDDEYDMVVAAYELGSTLHAEDQHRDDPYVYHLLRNAARAVGYLHVTDPDTIAAIILHDSVEDHPDELIAISSPQTSQLPGMNEAVHKQQLALEGVAAAFNPRVAEIVGGLTNPPYQPGEKPDYEERLRRYVAHVGTATEDPMVWVGKLVDWADNGLGIVHSDFTDDPARKTHFMRKYGAVAEVLQARFYREDLQATLGPTAKTNVERMFALAEERLTMPARN